MLNVATGERQSAAREGPAADLPSGRDHRARCERSGIVDSQGSYRESERGVAAIEGYSQPMGPKVQGPARRLAEDSRGSDQGGQRRSGSGQGRREEGEEVGGGDDSNTDQGG